MQLVLPSCLTARQRALVHSLAEQHGILHSSAGEGSERYLTLGAADAPAAPLPEGPKAADAVTDQQLAELLQKHLQIDTTQMLLDAAEAAAAGRGGGSPAASGGAVQHELKRAAIKGPSAKGLLTVEDFVSQVWLRLLQLPGCL